MFSKETCEMTIKILSTCYPLQFWEYSPAMELLSNHDGQAEFMDRLISLNGMKDFLIAYAKEDVCPPYEFSDDLGIIIGCVFSKEDKRTDRVLLLGPTFANDRSLKRLLDDLEIHDLSVSARKYIYEQFKDYPIIPINIFEQYLLMLHNAICDECLDFPAIRRKNFYHTKKTAAVPETNIATKAFMQALEDYKGNDASIRHLQQTSYKLNEDLSRDHAGVSGFEQQLVAAVEQGNMGLLDLIKEGGKFSNGIKIQLENDLQRCKYGSISLLTLCSRAAIRGGLSASISYSLMDTYTLAIDNCANVNDIAISTTPSLPTTSPVCTMPSKTRISLRPSAPALTTSTCISATRSRSKTCHTLPVTATIICPTNSKKNWASRSTSMSKKKN